MWSCLKERYVQHSGALLHTLMQKIHLIEQSDMSVDEYNSAFEHLMGPLLSMVTAIEHVPVEDAGIHDLFKLCLSGLLFGARRWVVSMAWQCARIRDVYHVNSSPMGAGPKWRQIILKIADTLLTNYSGGIAGIPVEAWTVQCGKGMEEDVKVVYRRNDDGSNTAVVCASASFLLPLPMRRVFDLLKNNLLRVKWDVLMEGGSVKEEVRVANGVGSDDSISILHVKHGNVGDTKMILQNSSYDASGSFLVYSSLDDQLIDKIMIPAATKRWATSTCTPPASSSFPLLTQHRLALPLERLGEP
ncbi:hypothetical protein EJB05_49609, partial [Eragrostis curvula]